MFPFTVVAYMRPPATATGVSFAPPVDDIRHVHARRGAGLRKIWATAKISLPASRTMSNRGHSPLPPMKFPHHRALFALVSAGLA